MTSFEIAREFSRLGAIEDACKSYGIALQNGGLTPEERMEAACFVLESGGDYRISYTALLNLYQDGFFRDDCLQILTDAFYSPNVGELEKRYRTNCKLLTRYPYIFRKDFPPFEQLAIRFFPYDDNQRYVPFFPAQAAFGTLAELNDGIIRHYFFRDLEQPVLARDIFSQYELEYLNDNVRPSEWVAKENHIYLHYADWRVFCAWLQVLDFRALLKDKKFVFLIEDEISQYPIDFKERFGIDYAAFPLRRVKIREVKRLIWHTQFSSSNGGDFFNEVFDAHPNLIHYSSIMYDSMFETVKKIRKFLDGSTNLNQAVKGVTDNWKNVALARDLCTLKDRTDKDIFVACYMQKTGEVGSLDPASRIAPALFFQPHFSNVYATLHVDEKERTRLDTNVYDAVHESPLFNAFKYVKVFTPIRRLTTSYGSTVRFMEERVRRAWKAVDEEGETEIPLVTDLIMERVLNRTYMRDPDDFLFRDSVVVRFEDGKLNPAATFTRLAEFLDLPYTESMTYCSEDNVRDVQTEAGNAIGFDPVTVYKTFDDYVTDSERRFIEYFMRDAYRYYGYGFQYYDGAPVDNERIQEWMKHFDRLDRNIEDSYRFLYGHLLKEAFDKKAVDVDNESQFNQAVAVESSVKQMIELKERNRQYIADTLQRGLRFVNKNGQPLEMTPMLQPDPALLVQPLYH